MTSHEWSIVVYLLFALAGVVLHLLGRRRNAKVSPFGVLLRHVMATRSNRIGVVAAWAWLGLHFFAR